MNELKAWFISLPQERADVIEKEMNRRAADMVVTEMVLGEAGYFPSRTEFTEEEEDKMSRIIALMRQQKEK